MSVVSLTWSSKGIAVFRRTVQRRLAKRFSLNKKAKTNWIHTFFKCRFYKILKLSLPRKVHSNFWLIRMCSCSGVLMEISFRITAVVCDIIQRHDESDYWINHETKLNVWSVPTSSYKLVLKVLLGRLKLVRFKH